MDSKLTQIVLTDHALHYGLDGKSAYEIAQKHGYEGTEQEYAEGPIVATDKANKAAGTAKDAAERAKKSASNADEQASRVRMLADHPPKIVEVEGLKYWAFWNEASKDYVTSEYRADDGMIIQAVEGTTPVLEVRGGNIYLCGELASLTLKSISTTTDLSIIRFASGATPTQFSYPEGTSITGWRIPQANTKYSLFIWQGVITMVYDE